MRNLVHVTLMIDKPTQKCIFKPKRQNSVSIKQTLMTFTFCVVFVVADVILVLSYCLWWLVAVGTMAISLLVHSGSVSDESKASLGGRERRPYFFPATTNFGDTSRDGDVNLVGCSSSSSSSVKLCKYGSETYKPNIYVINKYVNKLQNV